MRSRRDDRARDLDDGLGLVNYDSVAPTIRRRRGRFRVEPFLRPISLGQVSWIAFLLFWLLFGRIMVIFFMTGSFWSDSTKGVEIRLAGVVHPSDLDMFRQGAIVGGDGGRPILHPERHAVHELTASSLPELCSFCDTARQSGREPMLAVWTTADASYQDFIDAVEAAPAIARTCDCRYRLVILSDRVVPRTQDLQRRLEQP